jgi:hypothetical protein
MERTQPPDIDEVLHRLIEQPSYAAQVLTVTARLLERDTISEVTPWSLDQDLAVAETAILGTLPESVRHIASTRARRALPVPYAGNRGAYAGRLRAAAEALQ